MSVRLESAKRLTVLKSKIDTVTETPSNTLSESVDNVIAGYGAGGGVNMESYITNTPSFSADIQEITEDMEVHLERVPSFNWTFGNIPINAPKLTLYISNICTMMSRCFRGVGSTVKTIEIIGDTSNITNWWEAFSGKATVEQIICDFDLTNTTDIDSIFNGCSALKGFHFRNLQKTAKIGNRYTFLNCNALVDAIFTDCEIGNSLSFSNSPLLSDASIQSIIDSLVDLTNATTQTLTLHKDVKAKLTETQIATITNKNWTLA